MHVCLPSSWTKAGGGGGRHCSRPSVCAIASRDCLPTAATASGRRQARGRSGSGRGTLHGARAQRMRLPLQRWCLNTFSATVPSASSSAVRAGPHTISAAAASAVTADSTKTTVATSTARSGRTSATTSPSGVAVAAARGARPLAFAVQLRSRLRPPRCGRAQGWRSADGGGPGHARRPYRGCTR